ncbi:MAG: hypothetical protein A4S12_06875 [Proteobacteria bacterium SG_bin5]|nr:hypothetical protein [Sphingomonas sp.]OQW42056.1 MAG: hypothetical protein A4S12_06875 [Proteobacteria bacterium SG_bin5]
MIDATYAEALAIVQTTRNASTSHLQRKMHIGYNKAAALIERMELEGVVSRPDRNGARRYLGQDSQ